MKPEAALAVRHPVVELLGRYRAIFAAAWAARHELAGPQRNAEEAAFMPAALALQETPVHPAPRRTGWTIVALFSAALAWSVFGEIDIVAVAPGRIVVSDRTKVVQPLEAGVILAIHVRDGDRVAAGQLLVELDPTAAAADRRSAEEQWRAATREEERTSALLQALRSARAPARASDADAQLHAAWNDIAARRARLDAEAARRQAELVTVSEVVAKLEATLPMTRQRESDFKALADQGFVSGHAGQDRTRERVEIERDLATQLARRKEIEAALTESRLARTAYVADVRRQLEERHAKARLEAAQLAQHGAKTQQREQLMRLVAPVTGTVQQLSVHSPGGVVTPAQVLMTVVPEGADVTAEVGFENRDIGFVNSGQPAEVKIETFSFTRYGTVPATLAWVAGDAVVDEKRGAVFPGMLRLDRAWIDIEGKRVRLAAGMTVTAELKTGRRRVIEYLLDPLRISASESLRER